MINTHTAGDQRRNPEREKTTEGKIFISIRVPRAAAFQYNNLNNRTHNVLLTPHSGALRGSATAGGGVCRYSGEIPPPSGEVFRYSAPPLSWTTVHQENLRPEELS
ncbi:unnamed protein product [Gadus morhua 'NCC']